MITIEDVNEAQLEDFLLEFKNLGGVVDFSVMNISGSGTEYEKHFQAAVHTLTWIQELQKIYIRTTIDRHPGFTEKDFSHITFNSDFYDSGVKISAEEFFGPYFDIKNERIILLRSISKFGEPHYNNYCYHNEPETPENIIDTRTLQRINTDFITQGYADAFVAPPHRIGGQGDEANMNTGSLFVKMSKYLFADYNQMIIYKWSVNCSDYFDDGKEYWGSFFWTVYNPSKDWYIGITASTTD